MDHLRARPPALGHSRRRGDMIAFTAETPHQVTRIKTGERLVLVCFGYYVHLPML